jgi:hypothetical protein
MMRMMPYRRAVQALAHLASEVDRTTAATASTKGRPA